MTRSMWILPCLVFGLLLLVQGCGPNYAARATVKGKVTLDGKDLTAGLVTFSTKDGRHGSTNIGADGTYTMVDAPIGEVGISVNVTKPKMTMPGMPGVGSQPKAPKDVGKGGDGNVMTMPNTPKLDPSKIVLIPDRYSTIEGSGLTYTVTAGEQSYDIKLTK